MATRPRNGNKATAKRPAKREAKKGVSATGANEATAKQKPETKRKEPPIKTARMRGGGFRLQRRRGRATSESKPKSDNEAPKG